MKKLLLSLIGLLLTATLLAGPVGQEDAQSKALDFLNGKVSTSAGGTHRAQRVLQDLSLAASETAYYVFNVGEKSGFVIVSASDLTPDVLGYADEGAFDSKNIPDNMRAWLQGYADQIEWLEETQSTQSGKRSQRSHAVKASISPLMTTLWDQAAPYYYECPQVGDNYCVTGCLATAIAQVLYDQHKRFGFPLGTTKEIPGYTTPEDKNRPEYGNVVVSACPAIASFDWENMQDTYTGKEDKENVNAQAVAKLMRYCGTAVEMVYRPSTSSAFLEDAPSMLKEYFGYESNLQHLNHVNYTAAEWEDLIYGELEAGCPVMIGAQSTGGGHAFVCDGCGEDGYYHINWGWGGKANGYFLLQVLNPNDSGTGGSSTYDGFSMSQEILIGLRAAAAEEEPRLTISNLTYTGASTVAKDVVLLPFKSISLWNVQYETSNYDISVGLFDEEGNLLDVCAKTSLTVDKSSGTTFGASFPVNLSTVEEGKTYRAKFVCKKAGTGDDKWQECFGSDSYCVELVAGATDVTVTEVKFDLSISDVQLITDGKPTTLQTVQATINNSGKGVFRGDVLMMMGSQQLAGRGVEVPANGSLTTTFTFKPNWTGSPTVTFVRNLIDGATESISGSGSITISGAVTRPVLDFDISLNLSEGSPQYILGNEAVATVTITNNNDDAYIGEFAIVFGEKGSGSIQFSPQEIYVAPRSSITKTCRQAVEIGKIYKAFVVYYPNNSQVVQSSSEYEVRAAIALFQADGTKTMQLPSASLAVPAQVMAVDLRGQNTVTSVTPNANPNCLYLLDAGAATPSGITGNVVKGNVAENITLTDDGVDGFYSPVNFTAQHISYTRKFDQGLTAEFAGWNTILLPFDVTAVQVGEEAIDWFHSDSDKGKRFWVYGFVNDAGNTVRFAHTDAMQANVPYIIAVPSDAWGTQFDLTNKVITFEGTDATITGDAMSVLNGDNYVFKGITRTQTLTDAYVLNDAGTSFSKQTSAEVAPFRACFVASNRHAVASSLSIAFVSDDEATDIPSLEVAADRAQKQDNVVYNMQGMKVGNIEQWNSLPKGVYFVNGNKVFKKN